MCKKLYQLIWIALVVTASGVAQGAPLDPNDGSIEGNLCLWLRTPDSNFDPVTGVWKDVSGKGNNAEPVGEVAGRTYVAPTLSSGSNPIVFDNDFSTVKFTGNDDLLRASNLNSGAGLSELTIIAVYKVGVVSGGDRLVGFGSWNDGSLTNNFNLQVGDGSIRRDNGSVTGNTANHPEDMFFIRVARMNPSSVDQWYNSNGTLEHVQAISGSSYTTSNDNFYLGDLRAFGGDNEVAEVVVYNTALSDAQIEGISEWLQANIGVVVGRKLASNPSPAQGATDLPWEVVLIWIPVESAVQRDVYFGTVFDDVNDADRTNPLGVLVSQAQDATSYDPGRLDFGKTYFWRVDEVNAPPDYTIFKGDVWSFTVEPIGYPIANENIIATASSSFNAVTGPENTVNRSGLDENDLHSVEQPDMWLSSMTGPQPTWIQYEFDRVYKLHEMWVWNYDQMIEVIVGFGLKDVTIEYSANGVDWTMLAGVPEFAQAPGAYGYAHNTTVDFGGVAAKYVRITADDNWGFLNQYGLSEVRFFYIPVWVSQPNPGSRATNVGLDATLGFRAGREAAKHNVYFGIDEQAVIDGTAPVTTVTEAGHGPLSLDLGQTYYWRVDEVNEAETPTTWQGDIWNFATREYFVLEDFEAYDDYEPNRLFDTWIDGWGVPTNGATMGYPDPIFVLDEHFVETTIVHGGSQSAPLFYDNTAGATYSEVTRTVDAPRDWTQAGVKALTLWFYGDPNNSVTEQMYVKVNGSKVTYDGGADNITRIGWQMWYIDLAALGVNLSNVTELTIGLERSGAVGGKGVVYFDDIRLSPYDRQLVTSVVED